MTSVNISNLTNTVVVTDGVDGTVVSVITQGPQGPTGLVLDQASKVDKSVIYYDAAASTFKADSIWTVPTLSDGGNF